MTAQGPRCAECGEKMPVQVGPGRTRIRCQRCAGDKAAIAKAWREANPSAVAEYNAARRQQLRPRKCKPCGELFTPRRRDSRQCSPACWCAAHRSRAS